MGGKTALQLRTNLRTDLKDSGSLWSDAELNRCVERAYSDLSRYLPRMKVHELLLSFDITDESVTFPKDTDTDGVVAAEDISATVAGGSATIDGQPDVPRPLTITLTDANSSVTGMTVIVTGTDKDEKSISEIFHYSRGDSKTITGKKYFKTVYSVEFDQIAGNAAADVVNIGWGAYTAVWVYLSNHPVKEGSDSGADSASTVLTRNTDYYIDYFNGRVKAIADGEIAAEEACTFTYKKSQLELDLSSLTDLVRIERVEYPVGNMPQSIVPFDVWGDFITITGQGESSEQEYLREDEQVRVYYFAEHIRPDEYSPGSVPEFLENTINLVAGAYALLIYALKHEHQAETDLTSMRTSAASATSAQTAISTALTNIKKYLDGNSGADSAGILASITTDAAALRTAIGTALDAANTTLDLVESTLRAAIITALEAANTSTDLVDATMRATVVTALDAANVELDLIDALRADVATALAAANTELDAVDALRAAVITAVDAANSYLDLVATDLSNGDTVYTGTTLTYLTGASAPSMVKYLGDGDALLNLVNVGGEGQEVPEEYRRYAQTSGELAQLLANERENYIRDANARINAALGFTQEAAQRLSNIAHYIDQATGYVNEATGRINSINSFVSQAQGYIAEADNRVGYIRSHFEQARSYIEEASVRISNIATYSDQARGYVAEAESRLSNLRTYIDQAVAYQGIAEGFAREAEQRLTQLNQYLAVADRYAASATYELALADRYRAESDQRRTEAMSIWSSRNEYQADPSTASIKQIPMNRGD